MKIFYSLSLTIVFLTLSIHYTFSQNIDNLTYTTGDYIFKYPNSIVSPSKSSLPVSFSGSATVEYSANTEITLKDGFSAGGFSSGFFKAFISPPVPECISSLPYIENFEYGDGGWKDDAPEISWVRKTGESLDGNYFISFNQTINANKYSELYKKCYDFTNTVNPKITFDYKLQGNDLAKFVIHVYGDYDDEQFVGLVLNSSSNWSSVELDLSRQKGKKGEIIFYISNRNNSNYTVSGGLDNIKIFEKPLITITSPISTSTWTAGSSQIIKWTSKLINSGELLKIELYNGTSWVTLAESTPNDGQYELNYVPIVQSLVANAKLKITQLSNVAVNSLSEEFKITPPTLIITSPKTDDLWTSGSEQTIKWEFDGLLPGEGITIDIIDENGIGHFLATSSVEAKSKTVTLPNWTKPVGNAKIRIYLSNNSVIDDYSDPFTVSPNCASKVSTYPYVEGFENGLGVWTQDIGDDFDWTRYTGDAPQTYSGPSKAKEGSYYLYTDARGNNSPLKNTVIRSSCFDLSSLVKPELRFWYNMNGFGMGTMAVLISKDRGGNWTEVWRKNGDQGDVWKESILDLSSYKDKVIQIAFVGLTGWTFSSDMAIDAIKIAEVPPPCSSAISAFPYAESFETGLGEWSQDTNDGTDWIRHSGETPLVFTGPDAAQNGAYYMYIDSETPFIAVKTGVLTSPCFNIKSLENPELIFAYHMYGSSIGSLDLQVSTDGGSSWQEPVWTKSGNQGNNWFEETIDLSPYIGNSVKFRFRGKTNDLRLSDIAIDNIRIRSSNPCLGIALNSFPYHESFEAGSSSWKQNSGDDKDWTYYSFPTPKAFTGPDAAQEGSYYAFINCFDQNSKGSLSALLTSQCFDLTSLIKPEISFWYHMYGLPATGTKGMGTLTLQISTNGGKTWDNLWEKSSDQGNQWKKEIIDLTQYLKNSVKFRFAGVTGDAERSDIAVDNITIKGQSITLNSPIASTIWPSKSSQNILWESNKIDPTETLKIEYYNGASWVVLAASAVNDGSEPVSIPEASGSIANAQIRITLVSNTNVNALSSKFTINPPFLKITSPIATTIWVQDGTTKLVNWTSFGLSASENLKIEFYSNNTSSWNTIAASTINDGGEYVNIPNQNSSGSAKLKITLLSNPSTFIESETFSINIAKTISIISPTSSTIWTADGSSKSISWSNTGILATENVKIEFYDGTSWTTTIGSTVNDGIENIALPNLNSSITSARIRVSLVSNSSVSATSPSFTVNVSKSLTLTSPTSASTWISNVNQTVTWNSVGSSSSDNVKIEFYNGSAWNTLTSSTSNDGSEIVIAPFLSSTITAAKVKISLISNPAISSTSSNFTVNTSLCSGTKTLSSTSGDFSDGSGDANNYSNGMSCTWNIQVPVGKHLEIKYTIQGLDKRADCFDASLGDYIRINNTACVKASGVTFPYSDTYGLSNSTSSTMLVPFYFYSDNTIPAAGWTVTYTIKSSASSLSESASRVRNNLLESNIEDNSVFNIFPNPTTSILNIKSELQEETNFEITLSNTLGVNLKKINLFRVKEINQIIDMSDFSRGIYFIRLNNETKVFIKKIILE